MTTNQTTLRAPRIRHTLLCALLLMLISLTSQEPVGIARGEPVPIFRSGRSGQVSDLKALQGSWRLIRLIRADEDQPLGDNNEAAFTITNATFVSAVESPSPFSLKPDKLPKQIDVTVIVDTEQVKMLGIYRLEGDKLTICWTGEKERPTSFETKTPWVDCMVFERMK